MNSVPNHFGKPETVGIYEESETEVKKFSTSHIGVPEMVAHSINDTFKFDQYNNWILFIQ